MDLIEKSLIEIIYGYVDPGALDNDRPWAQKCSNCHFYEAGQCKLHGRPTGYEDWCKDYKRNEQRD